MNRIFQRYTWNYSLIVLLKPNLGNPKKRKIILMNNMMKALAFALLTSASVPGAVYAQQGVALFGKIQDENGDPIAGVTLTLVDGQQQTSSNAQGEFSFTGIISFPVQLRADAIGYKPVLLDLNAASWNAKKGVRLLMVAGDNTLDEVLVTGRRNNSYLTNDMELGGKFAGKLKSLPQSVAVLS